MIVGVREVMTKDVATARPDTPFRALVRAMHEHRVGALPVIDAFGIVIGVVSETDLVLKEDPGFEGERQFFERRGERRARRRARGRCAVDVMTAPAVTVTARATLGEAAHLMHRTGVSHLPVVDAAGAIVGIVSRGDLLASFLREDHEIECEVRRLMERTSGIPSTDVAVRSDMGVVRLEGRVDRRTVADDLAREVRRVDGVVDVDLRVRWDEDDTALVLRSLTPVGPRM